MRASVILISAAILAATAVGLMLPSTAYGVETVEVSEDVELYEAAYTDQPRVSTLPESGGSDTLAVFAAGAVVGGILYAITPKPHRLKA